MANIKSELKYLIEQETDVSVLKAIKTILNKTQLDPVLKEKLTRRANASEDDIRNGRILTRKEAQKKLD
jgi:hypothetical protein